DTSGEKGAFGDASAEGGQRSDTLMVAHVEPAAKRTFVLSFPRDLLVNIPGTAGKQKIKAAYDIGGAQTIIDTLKANFDIDMNHYLEVDFKSFRAIVDAIGTVPVYFPYPARDELSGLNVAFGGCDQLDGTAALQYVRSRYLEFLENGRWTYVGQDAPDLYRIARQQQFIRELVGIAVNRSLGDPSVAVDVSDRVLQYLKADQNLSRGDVNALIRSFRTVDANNTSSLDMETVPVTPNPTDPGSTLI